MNWQAWPQRLGSEVRDRPQSVHKPRAGLRATVGVMRAGAIEYILGLYPLVWCGINLRAL